MNQWSPWELARQAKREWDRSIKWSTEHYSALRFDRGMLYWIGFQDGILFYEWDPELKELTRWHPISCPGFGNLSVPDRFVKVNAMLRKIPDSPTQFVEVVDKVAMKRWPTLWEHLTQRSYDDESKSPRQTSTITLFRREDGVLGATLNDRDNGRACFACSGSLEGLLDAIEKVAAHPDTIWREDRQKTGSSKRKK